MRKINSILTILILLLFADHAIFGTLNTLGKAKVLLPIARILGIVVILHAIISIILTIRAAKVSIRTKAPYNKENQEYWMRRWTGLAILFFFIGHLAIVKKQKGQAFKIATAKPIGKISFILFVASIAAHLVINIKPLLISLGVKSHKTINTILNILYAAICAGAVFACVLSFIGGGK